MYLPKIAATAKKKNEWESNLRLLALHALVLTALLGVASQPAHAQTYSVLYNFCSQGNCADGAFPNGDLILDAQGNLYGTAVGGGLQCSQGGCGTVFRLTPAGEETVLHSFDALLTGAFPGGGLVRDSSGNLYGTTSGGGCKKLRCGFGVVYKLTPAGDKSVLFAFQGSAKGGAPNGGHPSGPLVLDGQGNLYGTTTIGGDVVACDRGCGVAFKVSPAGLLMWQHSFSGLKGDGKFPNGGLFKDAQGNFFGTNLYGVGPGCVHRCGSVFKISPDGTASTVYAFQGTGFKRVDGEHPSGALIADAQGNLYGVTAGGGANESGTVFRIAPDGTETVIYNFGGQPDGAAPKGRLVMDAHGNLFGVTSQGGANNRGAVFELNAAGQERILYSFTVAGSDGNTPSGGLTLDPQGNLYGTTFFGGAAAGGVVFQLKP